MSNVITIAGVAIRQDGQGRYSLNDLHRASGGEKRHGPSYWMESQQTQDLIEELGDTENPVSVVRGGTQQGTYVAKELVYAYAMWISAAFHLKVIRTFDTVVTGRAMAPMIPQSLPEALRLAADLAEQKAIAEQERDEAVRAKALIGNKREATAMATASTAKREAERLRRQLGRNKHHATIIAVEQVTGMRFANNAYVGLRRWCKAKGVSPVEVVDERYGSVKAWPAGAWLDVYNVNLRSLFSSLVGDGVSLANQ